MYSISLNKAAKNQSLNYNHDPYGQVEQGTTFIFVPNKPTNQQSSKLSVESIALSKHSIAQAMIPANLRKMHT